MGWTETGMCLDKKQDMQSKTSALLILSVTFTHYLSLFPFHCSSSLLIAKEQWHLPIFLPGTRNKAQGSQLCGVRPSAFAAMLQSFQVRPESCKQRSKDTVWKYEQNRGESWVLHAYILYTYYIHYAENSCFVYNGLIGPDLFRYMLPGQDE